MKRTHIGWLAVGAITLGAIAAVEGPSLSLWFQLSTKNLSAPERDVSAALANAKPVCFSVNGYARYFPGVKSAAARSFCETIEKNFSGTSDVVVGPWNAKLQQEAIAYASAYNAVVLSALKVENHGP